jgi:hypothetical protein
VGTVLAVTNLQAGSERYRNVADFVEAFCNGFQSLLQSAHHPKWREVNIMAEFPGWRRSPPAAAPTQCSGSNGAQIRGAQGELLAFHGRAPASNGSTHLNEQEKDQLFDQFKLWASQHIPYSARGVRALKSGSGRRSNASLSCSRGRMHSRY